MGRIQNARQAEVKRTTKETQIAAFLNLDGSGTYQIHTPFPFLDHMLSGFAKQGIFDLTLAASGDTEIDDHHTVEDIGIVLGQTIAKTLENKEGVCRFGHAVIPLDEALSEVTVDLSGRAYSVYNVRLPRRKIKAFDTDLIGHFFRSLADHSRMTLHINLRYGTDPHHILETVFKGFGRALHQATRLNKNLKGVASTKGML